MSIYYELSSIWWFAFGQFWELWNDCSWQLCPILYFWVWEQICQLLPSARPRGPHFTIFECIKWMDHVLCNHTPSDHIWLFPSRFSIVQWCKEQPHICWSIYIDVSAMKASSLKHEQHVYKPCISSICHVHVQQTHQKHIAEWWGNCQDGEPESQGVGEVGLHTQGGRRIDITAKFDTKQVNKSQGNKPVASGLSFIHNETHLDLHHTRLHLIIQCLSEF